MPAPETCLFPHLGENARHGQDCHSDRGGNAEGALESASRLLGVFDRAGEAPSSGERRIRKGREERDLEAWAKENGCWRDEVTAFGPFVHGGEEHRIFRGDDFYLKATHSGRYGFTVIATPGGPTLTHALPGEYLRRLIASNRIFNDSVTLVGVARDETGLVIVTSQPTIIGEGATKEEMITFFAGLHFALVPGFSAGYRGALTFYRDLDQAAVFDAHPANYLRDRHGVILPIDGVVVECDEALAAQMEALL